jgi:hypothetical protein
MQAWGTAVWGIFATGEPVKATGAALMPPGRLVSPVKSRVLTEGKLSEIEPGYQ